MYFTDIHCHMLPGADDGSKSREESLEMLKIAYQEGIRRVCVTPHYQPDRFAVDENMLQEQYTWLETMAGRLDSRMEIVLGNEMFFGQDAMDELEEGRCRTLNNSGYVLVEFHPGAEYPYIVSGLSQLMSRGYEPVLAHVERYEALTENRRRVRELRERGVVIQVNAGTITGMFGRSAEKFARKILKERLADVVSTDSHSSRRRAPRLTECFELVARKYGAEYAELMFAVNPQRILENKKVGDI